MEQPMKHAYIISLPDAKGTMVQFNIVCETMAQAIVEAQKRAGTTSEPHTAQRSITDVIVLS